ncbi:MAG: ATP-binding cassette domain-containing protein [Sedimentisphaerales bacterium]|nr:ATP-binding cassette domain-containing protein [Sedimentisphaerales bacterium]
MKAFTRVFAYLWPQWTRVVAVICSAVVIAILLSASFMTLIPLLTVMMGTEGLPGWLDRKVCDSSYGLEFRVPQPDEMGERTGLSPRSHLRVTDVKEGRLAEAAGIRRDDWISDVNDVTTGQPDGQVSYVRLLEALATYKGETLRLEIQRPADGGFTSQTIDMATPYNDAYIDSLDWSALKRVKFYGSLVGLRAAQRLVGLLPREQTPRNRIIAVVAIMILVTVLTLIRCIAKFYQDYLGQKVVQVAISNLRQDVFAHLTHMPIAAFARERPSDTISRIERDTSTMGLAIQVLLGKALREPMNALFMLIFAMVISWKLTLVFLCGAPFVLALLSAFGSKMKKATRGSLVASSQMLAKLQEVVAGLRVVKVYNQQKYEQRAFARINQQLLKQLLRISKVDAAAHPVLEILGILAGAAAIIIGMVWVTRESLQGPDFLTLLVLLGAAAEAVRKTSDIWNRIQQANAAAERVFDVVDQPVEFEKLGAAALPAVKGNVVFRDVVFSYPQTDRVTLDHINLSVTAGHNVAIVGPNGSGKTTLANLLPRFYDPDSGQILIDGHDIREVTLESLRDQIGMVTQNVITFNDTVRANIAYGRYNATEEDVVTAAQRAFAHEFISQLPKGYDTIIGEHGVGLSGGQLQRIVIARAILKNPSILIFDEATSQVDADSEAKIHKAIEEVMRDRTTFIIAHRFSTVVAADVIVVMDRGQIIAQGQHEQLMQTCRIYQGLYEMQLVKG